MCVIVSLTTMFQLRRLGIKSWKRCGIFKCLLSLMYCTRSIGSDHSTDEARRILFAWRDVHYLILVYPMPLNGGKHEICYNCSQCLFNDAFHIKCDFCLRLFILLRWSRTDDKLLAVTCSVSLISMQQSCISFWWARIIELEFFIVMWIDCMRKRV
jgi:hypothetical protein